MALPKHTNGMIDRAIIDLTLPVVAELGSVSAFEVEEYGEPTDHVLIPSDADRFPFVFHMNEHHLHAVGALVAAKPDLPLATLADMVRFFFSAHAFNVRVADAQGEDI